jgi:hypothetical protein
MSGPELSSRLSGRVESRDAKNLVNGYKRAANADDTYRGKANAGQRITLAKAKSIAELLTDQDHEIIRLLDQVRLLSGRQLRHLLNSEDPSGARTVRRRLSRLSDLRVVYRLGRRVGGARSGSDGYVFTLDVIGQLIVSSGARRRRPWTPSDPYIGHGLAVSQCFVTLRTLERDHRFDLLRFDTEPICWRRFFGPGGVPSLLAADAYCEIGLGDWLDRYFIEVDMATEAPSRIRTKAKNYIDYWSTGREQADTNVFPFVLWVTPSQKRSTQIVDTLGRLPADHWRLFKVCTVDQFGDVMTGDAENET